MSRKHIFKKSHVLNISCLLNYLLFHFSKHSYPIPISPKHTKRVFKKKNRKRLLNPCYLTRLRYNIATTIDNRFIRIAVVVEKTFVITTKHLMQLQNCSGSWHNKRERERVGHLDSTSENPKSDLQRRDCDRAISISRSIDKPFCGRTSLYCREEEGRVYFNCFG